MNKDKHPTAVLGFVLSDFAQTRTKVGWILKMRNTGDGKIPIQINLAPGPMHCAGLAILRDGNLKLRQ
ncbi:MAG: hypothetical protein AB3N23_21155 [Paracoccaceae bacterium]